MFEVLKNKLIKMNFLYHTPKSYLEKSDMEGIKKYGLVHFTYSKNINNILGNGVLPGKRPLYKREKNFCWFYINFPEDFDKNLSIIRSKGKRSEFDCYIIIKDFSVEQLNNMRIRKDTDNAVVHIGSLKTHNMKAFMIDDKTNL